jgi:hypothetical protein
MWATAVAAGGGHRCQVKAGKGAAFARSETTSPASTLSCRRLVDAADTPGPRRLSGPYGEVNKVTAAAARATVQALQAGFQPAVRNDSRGDRGLALPRRTGGAGWRFAALEDLALAAASGRAFPMSYRAAFRRPVPLSASCRRARARRLCISRIQEDQAYIARDVENRTCR